MRTGEQYKKQARLLKVLANETRLKILDTLSEGECQVGEIAQVLGAEQSTVSKHLAMLRNLGVVDDDRRGNMVFYRLLTPCVLNFFSCATEFLRERG